MQVPEDFKAACLPLYLSMVTNGRHNSDMSQAWTLGKYFWTEAFVVRPSRLRDEIDGRFSSFQTASMLALVLNCSFLFPNLEICRNASTP